MYPETDKLLIDHHENASGIPDFIVKKIPNISFKNLKAGDYLIPKRILIERKTASDLIQSLKNHVLFEQCKKLKMNALPVLMIIEGNPL